MDYEGHLVSMVSHYTNFQLSNESIEHLSNFPHLRNFHFSSFTSKSNKEDNQVTNFSLLSNLRMLSIMYEQEIQDSEFFKDLGLFSNLLSLSLLQPTAGTLMHLNHDFVMLFRYDYNSSRFFQIIQFSSSFFDKLHFSRF